MRSISSRHGGKFTKLIRMVIAKIAQRQNTLYRLRPSRGSHRLNSAVNSVDVLGEQGLEGGHDGCLVLGTAVAVLVALASGPRRRALSLARRPWRSSSPNPVWGGTSGLLWFLSSLGPETEFRDRRTQMEVRNVIRVWRIN